MTRWDKPKECTAVKRDIYLSNIVQDSATKDIVWLKVFIKPQQREVSTGNDIYRVMRIHDLTNKRYPPTYQQQKIPSHVPTKIL